MKPTAVGPVGFVPVEVHPPPACSASDPAVVLQRIDWLFRGTTETRPMQQLREMLLRYRLEKLR